MVDLIRDDEDVRMLTYEVARELARAAGAVRRADRHAVLARAAGHPGAGVLRGHRGRPARRRRRASGIELRWCFDIPGEAGLPAAEETLRIALEQRPDGLISFGLGGPEIGVPRPQFKPYFDKARAAGLHSVPHAGETTGPETIWDALRDLGAERIGHGISAAQDPRLMAYLAEHQIPLEVCPTSNVRTRAVPTLDEHPLPALVAAGVPVTHQLRRPADVRHHPRARSTRSPPGCSTSTRPGVADLARAAVRRVVPAGRRQGRAAGRDRRLRRRRLAPKPA